LDDELLALRDRDLFRTLTTIEDVQGPVATVHGRPVVVWCANDYLGLAQHPRLIQAACDAARCWGIGARASRLLAGSSSLHQQLEARLAGFFHAEAAAVFPSGYLANLGVLRAFLNAQDVVLVDRLAHASLIDACRFSGATVRVFRHNDVAHAAQVLQRAPRARRRVIVTEGLFSMDGDFAPLEGLVELAGADEAFLYLDDAHGAFAVGATGRGSPERAGVSSDRLIYMGTLGKALGCQGGFVVGPTALSALIQNRARTFLYSTALAPPVVAAALEALRLIEDEPDHRRRLDGNVRFLHSHGEAPLPIRDRVPSHIVPMLIGASSRAREVAAALWERGIFAPAIRPPTVPNGTARLRLSLSASHTDGHIRQLLDALREVGADLAWAAPGAVTR